MSIATAFTVEPMRPTHADAWLKFFDHVAFADNPRWASCYCQFPTADHQVIEWKQRTGEENRASACQRIEAGLQRGVVAWAEGAIVGWCNAGPWGSMTIFDDEMAGAGEDVPADRIAAITCFVVAPAWRGRGVSQALLRAACEMLASEGFAAAQAWTRPGGNSPTANRTGSFTLYQRAGFTVWREAVGGGVLVRKRIGGS